MAFREGDWERINRSIGERLRVRSGRDPQPSAGVVDSQSVKSTAVDAEQRGYDGGKKVKGLKSATSWWTPRASYSQGEDPQRKGDGLWEGIKTLLWKADERFPRLLQLWLDAGYRGEGKGKDWVQKTLGWTVDLVERPKRPAPEEVLMRWARSGPKKAWQ
jgi:putative transposase